jgi:hypothetical protein
MGEAGGHNRHSDADIEHLSGHEVPQVVKSEVTESRGLPGPDEALGHVVRFPGSRSILVLAEDEPVTDFGLSVSDPGEPSRKQS